MVMAGVMATDGVEARRRMTVAVRRGRGGGARTSSRWPSRTIPRARAAVVMDGGVQRVLETEMIKAGSIDKVTEALRVLRVVRLEIVGVGKFVKAEMDEVMVEG